MYALLSYNVNEQIFENCLVLVCFKLLSENQITVMICFLMCTVKTDTPLGK